MPLLFKDLDKHQKPEACRGCPLHSIGASYAGAVGTGRNGVLLLGEALGDQEAIKGLPFVGDSGLLLNRVLKRGGWEREDFLISNIVRCHPPNNYLDGAPYEPGAVAHCKRYLDELLAAHPEIKVIVPTGNIPLFALLGKRGIKNNHGTVSWHDGYGRWVVPTLHPSFVLRTGCKEFPTVLFDIGRALNVARNGFSRSQVDYILHPTTADVLTFCEQYERVLAADPRITLAADIETAYSSEIDEEELLEKDNSWDITRISFSFRPNEAITFRWSEDYKKFALRLLSSSGIKCFWNGNKFDVPRLLHQGMHFGGTTFDAMDAWHTLRPDLPRGLGYVAPFFTDLPEWKSQSKSDPEYYSAVDADALLRIALALRAAHEREGTWDHFNHYWTGLEPILEGMSQIGIGIDPDVRAERTAYYENVRDNTNELIQEHIPDDLRPHLKKGGYKGKPKDVRLYIKENKCDEDEAWRACGYSQFKYRGEDGDSQTEVLRWNKLEPFNYNSPQQIIRYITDRYGSNAVPRDKKTGNPTTGADELERLARKYNDEVLYLILDAANADGKITSFINPWEPSLSDGRVHGIFTNTPATARLASQNPNLQNFPRREKEALELRKMIVPGDGWEWLVEADYKSIEAIMVGWYARDPDYTRIAYLGIHDFMAGNKLGMRMSPNMSDADLRIALKEAKKLGNKTMVPGTSLAVREACKVSVHGGNYLEGPVLLHRTYPELFATTKVAEEYQDYYFDLFPKISNWQQATVEQAHETSYVRTAWGFKRWFWNVKAWRFMKRSKKWELVMADDAKKAVATNPQSSAGMCMRGALVREPIRELLEERCLMLSVHDSLVARARDKKHRDWVIERLRLGMEYPLEPMGGIVIPVEVKVGRNWGEMEDL